MYYNFSPCHFTIVKGTVIARPSFETSLSYQPNAKQCQRETIKG